MTMTMTINSAAKILGFLLLIAGVILIGWTLINSYNIFTGKIPAPEIFAMPETKTLTQTGIKLIK